MTTKPVEDNPMKAELDEMAETVIWNGWHMKGRVTADE